MSNKIIFDKKLRKTIRKTTETLAKAVKSTLGPSGTNVGLYSKIHLPIVVNDGVTVAETVSFDDPFQSYICKLLKTVSQNTDNIANDGTTTSLTLAEAIIMEGIKNIELGFSQIDVVKGIRIATLEVLKQLDNTKISLKENKEMLRQIANISANNDMGLGNIIADAFMKVGVDGQMEIKDSVNKKTYVEIINGMRYDSGYESNMFNNTDKGICHFENAKILLYEGKLKDLSPLAETLKELRKEDTPLLIVADDFTEETINDLTYNKLSGGFKLCAVRSPGYGDAKEKDMDDLALITKAKVISKRFGLKIEDFTADLLGEATDVKVKAAEFTLSNESADKEEIDKVVKTLKEDIEKETHKNIKAEIQNRIARLTNGTAIIYVHGDSPVEIVEKKYRIEDAIGATRASMEDGVVPGGGLSLFTISENLVSCEMENESQLAGYNIIVKALKAPIETICINSGVTPEIIMEEIKKSKIDNYGFDAKNKKYGDMLLCTDDEEEGFAAIESYQLIKA